MEPPVKCSRESVTAATYSINDPSAAKPQPKGEKGFHRRDTEFAEVGRFFTKSFLLGLLCGRGEPSENLPKLRKF